MAHISHSPDRLHSQMITALHCRNILPSCKPRPSKWSFVCRGFCSDFVWCVVCVVCVCVCVWYVCMVCVCVVCVYVWCVCMVCVYGVCACVVCACVWCVCGVCVCVVALRDRHFLLHAYPMLLISLLMNQTHCPF